MLHLVWQRVTRKALCQALLTLPAVVLVAGTLAQTASVQSNSTTNQAIAVGFGIVVAYGLALGIAVVGTTIAIVINSRSWPKLRWSANLEATTLSLIFESLGLLGVAALSARENVGQLVAMALATCVHLAVTVAAFGSIRGIRHPAVVPGMRS